MLALSHYAFSFPSSPLAIRTHLRRSPTLRQSPKHQLRLHAPALRYLVHLRGPRDHTLHNLIMLQICAEAGGVKGGPERELVHAGGLKRPVGEDVFVCRELACPLGYRGAVFVEDGGAVGGDDAVDYEGWWYVS